MTTESGMTTENSTRARPDSASALSPRALAELDARWRAANYLGAA